MQQFDRQNSTPCTSHSFAILLIPFLFLVGLVLAYLGIFPINVEAHTFGIVALCKLCSVSYERFFFQHGRGTSGCIA